MSLITMGITIGTTAWLLSGCTGTGDAPPPYDARSAPIAFFLVHNELFSIRLDGTDRHSLGLIGDNKWRTGWPRQLPDGRALVLGDEDGGIFPFFESNGRMVRLNGDNVTLNDSLCGAVIDGQPRMVITTTPFIPTRTVVERIDVDNPAPELMHIEKDGVIANPAPYDDGRVVAVRNSGTSSDILLLDVATPRSPSKQPQVLASLELPYFAASPARLADGRVVFIRLDSREAEALQPGEMWVIEPDGSTHETGISDIVNLIVIDEYVVYETGGMNRISDIVATDLVHAPINVTHTPYVSEHIGWSD